MIIHLQQKKINVSKSTLSNYCERITQKHKISIAQVRKLVPTLSTTKTKYVLHHRNLQFYMDSLKYSSKPTFKRCKRNRNLAAIHKIKEPITLKTPTYMGMSISS